MKGFTAFLSKEILELVRTKKLIIIVFVFIIFGILNPATAKLTPQLLKSIAVEGMTIGEINVTALDSWSQFAKNLLTALIVLLIMFSGIYTSEYSKGTLIPLLTKGLSRSSVVLSKSAVMFLTWSFGIWLCFGITYFYSDYYWDNSIVKGIFFAGFCWWLFGIFMIACIMFFSSFAESGVQVMLGTGAVYIVMSLTGMYGKAKKFLPVRLTDSLSLYKGTLEPSEYICAVIITSIASFILVIASLLLTRKRNI